MSKVSGSELHPPGIAAQSFLSVRVLRKVAMLSLCVAKRKGLTERDT